MNSARQQIAEKAGFQYLQLSLTCGATKKEWLCPQNGDALTVERAVLSHYRQEGWRGFWGERGLLHTLIKAMSLESLDYMDRTNFLEGIFTVAADPDYGRPYTLAKLLDQIPKATVDQVARNFDVMNSQGPHVEVIQSGFTTATFNDEMSLQDRWPGMERWMVLELMEVAGVELLHRIATIFSTAPYDFRSGWPDLTIWRDGQLRFVEVKAPGDKLTSTQKNIAKHFALPLNLDFWMVDVIPAA